MNFSLRQFGLGLCALTAFMLAGCTSDYHYPDYYSVYSHYKYSYSLVKPERQSVGRALSVEPGMEWNRVASAKEFDNEVWTLDGPVLNQLIFFEGVHDNEPLFKPVKPGSEFLSSEKKDEKRLVFRGKMGSFEIQELVQATIAKNFQTTNIECKNLKPIQFAGGSGFRFDMKFTPGVEVERKGVFLGTVRGGRLYGMWFFGAKSYYFDRYLPEFTRLADSARIAGTSEAAK